MFQFKWKSNDIHRHPSPSSHSPCAYQAIMVYWNGSQKVRDTGICRGSSLCVKYGGRPVALCHYSCTTVVLSLIKNGPIVYWSLLVSTVRSPWTQRDAAALHRWNMGEPRRNRARKYYLISAKLKNQIMGEIALYSFYILRSSQGVE